MNYPESADDPFLKAGYKKQQVKMSPARFGEPMNRRPDELYVGYVCFAFGPPCCLCCNLCCWCCFLSLLVAQDSTLQDLLEPTCKEMAGAQPEVVG
jgi:hypothetical protein